MGDFRAGEWLLIALFFIIVITLGITLFDNAEREVFSNTRGAENTNIDIILNQSTNPYYFEKAGYCTGDGQNFAWFNKVICNKFDNVNDELSCNATVGCEWRQGVFNDYCYGHVNSSYYGLKDEIGGSFCDFSPGLKDNRTLCQFFECEWIQLNDSDTFASNPKTAYNSVLKTFVWVIAFKHDFGLGNFNWIISLLFDLILLFVIIWGIYQALPFI